MTANVTLSPVSWRQPNLADLTEAAAVREGGYMKGMRPGMALRVCTVGAAVRIQKELKRHSWW